MSKLLKIEKFFKILENQGRVCNNRYLGWSKANPHIAYCEQQVFVKRAWKKVLPSLYVKLYDVEYKTVQYLYITMVDFYLGHGTELEIYFLDFANLSLGIQCKVLSYDDINRLEGEFLDGEVHKKINKLFLLTLLERTPRFEAFDSSNYFDAQKRI